MIEGERATEVIEHFRRYPDSEIRTSSTFLPGFASCINPVPTICGPEVYCRPEDYGDVRRIKESIGL